MSALFTHPEISEIQNKTSALRYELLEHPVYERLKNLDNMQRFMELHVYAVWDFMSLLKCLQQRLCCLSVPWVPSAYPAAARFINEIVLAEESDVDGQGGYLSHFELYLKSMEDCGAQTAPMRHLLELLQEGSSLEQAVEQAQVPTAAAQFLRTTFDVIESGDLSAIASAFTFGREGLLPDLFAEIVVQLNQQLSGTLGTFQYYLERHIELDGDEHGPMANRLMVAICQEDPLRWQSAETAAIKALQARKLLWDGILESIEGQAASAASAPLEFGVK